MSFEKYIKSKINTGSNVVPRDEMWKNINQNMLTSSHKKRKKYTLLLVLLMVFFIGLFSILIKQNNEINSLKEHITQIEMEQSVPQKLKYLHTMNEHGLNDDEIVDVLLDRLRSDPSKHVRLASVRILENYIDRPAVRVSMIDKLGAESDTYVIISIVRLLSSVREKKALPTYQKIYAATSNQSALAIELNRAIALIS